MIKGKLENVIFFTFFEKFIKYAVEMGIPSTFIAFGIVEFLLSIHQY